MSASGLLMAKRLAEKDRSFRNEVIDVGVRALNGFNLTPKEKKAFLAGLIGKVETKRSLLPSRKTKSTGGIKPPSFLGW